MLKHVASDILNKCTNLIDINLSGNVCIYQEFNSTIEASQEIAKHCSPTFGQKGDVPATEAVDSGAETTKAGSDDNLV